MFNPWVGKIPWRRERLPTLVFWSEEFHGLYSPWGHKESDTTEKLSVSEKEREFQEKKNIYLCFIDYAKAFDCVCGSRQTVRALREMRIPDHLLRNLYAGQLATVRALYGTTD